MTTRSLRTSICCAGSALAALLGFTAVSMPLAALSPFPAIPVVGQKLNHLRQHRADFDTVFIGSSRVHCEIIPAAFDKITGTHSFNAGVPAMTPPESLYFARRVLALRLPRLKWMFVELEDLNSAIDLRTADTSRGAYWHDARHTLMACLDLWNSPRSAPRKFSIAAQHLQLFFKHAANIGRGASMVAEWLPPRARKDRRPDFTDDRGFTEVTTKISEAQNQYIRAGLEEMRSRAWPPIPLRPVYREALRELIGEMRREGIEPIFFIAPGFTWRNRLTGPAEARLLNLSDEARFPALFDPQNYGDTIHLNGRGAAVFTTALAEQFTALR